MSLVVMPPLERPPIKDVAFGSRKAHLEGGYVVEPKYDGIWGRAVIEGRVVTMVSRNGQQKDRWSLPDVLTKGKTILEGEFMFGSNWSRVKQLTGLFFAFDCTMYDGLDVRFNALHTRRTYAEEIVRVAKCHRLRLVPQRRLEAPVLESFDMLWDSWVVREGYEGLMVKSPFGYFGDQWFRFKTIFTVDYICLGFNQSNAPKYKGRMVKSIQAGLLDKSAKIHHVCDVSGLSDEDRRLFFLYPERYRNRVFEVSGKQVFPSGAMRHPNFVRWRSDKAPSECTTTAARKVGGHE